MSYYLRKLRKNSGKHTLGLLYIGLAILIVIALYGARAMLESAHVAIDPDTLCPIDGSPNYVAIVFDKTDAYNPIQQQFLKRFFTRLKSELPTGTRISLFVIEAGAEKRIQPEFVFCSPQSGEDASYWTANPKALRKRWKERFEKPLDAAIEAFMRPSTAENSPIFEILQIVALSGFPPGSEKAEKLLIIVSDMLHHTPEWSHYRGETDVNGLLKTPYYHKIRTDLHDTEVRILYVRRDGAEHLQTKGHAYFWADYLNSINGRVTLIEKIDG
ncbi:MAG: hypothetical protein L0Y43_01570 [Methylococcaceae bacterium]|nr:hypothetical protein [Methylococcaceae bacterium]